MLAAPLGTNRYKKKVMRLGKVSQEPNQPALLPREPKRVLQRVRPRTKTRTTLRQQLTFAASSGRFTRGRILRSLMRWIHYLKSTGAPSSKCMSVFVRNIV